MPRFKKPMTELLDRVPSIKSDPPSTHAYDAVAAIGRLKDDGRRLWGDGSREFARWKSACDLLWKFLNSEMGERRFQRGESLGDALKDFIDGWDHERGRLSQMLQTKRISTVDRRSILDWMEFIFRLSIGAIVSFWTRHVTDMSLQDTGVVTFTMEKPEAPVGVTGDRSVEMDSGAETPFKRRVYKLIGRIPRGHVMEYADISCAVRGDRFAAGPVGRIVWDDKPEHWWRVVFCEGGVDPDQQASLLRAEGIEIMDRRINPSKYAEYRWWPGE